MYCPKKERIKSFLIILPIVAILFVFIYGFIGWSIKVSFSAWDGIIKNDAFVGLANYKELFKFDRFPTDIWNTIFFTLMFMLVCITGGFILAYMLYSGLKAEGLFRTIYMFPLAIAFVISGVLWRWILAPETGINVLLRMFGFNGSFNWYVSTKHIGPFNLALIALIIAASWEYLGYTMAMFLAGLRAIPQQIIESAQIDGANKLTIIFKIIIPQIKPIVFSAMIVIGHVSLKIFDLAYAMTGKGPNFVTDFPGLYMFETTFRGNHYGEGAAISIFMLLLVAIIIVPYLISTFKGEK